MATKTRKVTSIEVSMKLEKETKNTYRFAALDDDAAVETLYVQKTAFGDTAPTTITVTLS